VVATWEKALDYLRNWQAIEMKREKIRLNWTPEAKQADEKLMFNAGVFGWCDYMGESCNLIQ